jgi:hemolysin activation/secretion protein
MTAALPFTSQTGGPWSGRASEKKFTDCGRPADGILSYIDTGRPYWRFGSLGEVSRIIGAGDDSGWEIMVLSRYRRIGVIAGTLLASTAAFSQSASQITPRSFAPPIQGSPDSAGFSIGELSNLETPPGAENLFVTLSSVSVSNESAELAEAGAQVRARLVGRRVSGAEIFAAARDLEAAYSRAGYVLVRVILPPQDLIDGASLRLNVIDGYIERIETQGVARRVRRRIERLVAPLVGKHLLKLKEIEKRVLLAGDVPGVILRSALAPGSETGAAVLVLDTQYRFMDATLSADNSLSRALGGHQVGVATDLNGVLGLGELAYARAGGDQAGGGDGFWSAHPRNRSLAAGFILPLGIEGDTVNVEGTQAHTTPLEVQGTQSTDAFERLSLRLRHPWIRSRDFNLASQIVLDAENEHEDLISPAPLPLFDDRVRVLRMVQEWNRLDRRGGDFSGSFTVSYGFDALGARSAAEASPALPLSRQGVQAGFKKLETSLSYARDLAAHLNANVSLRGQYSFGRAMARGEEFGIADPDGLSAFDAGSLQGDSGYVARAEVASPWVVPLRSGRAGVLVSPYGFGATGKVYEADPTALEAKDIGGGSYGVGVRVGSGIAGSPSTASLNLEVARESGGDVHDATRVRLSASVKF